MQGKQAVVETAQGTFVIRTAARSRAEPRRLLHQARARGRATTARRSIARSGWGSSRAATRCRRIPRRRRCTARAGSGVLDAEINARADDARRGRRRTAARESRTAPARSSSSPSPINSRSTGSSPSSAASSRAWRSCRRSRRRPSTRNGRVERADRDHAVDDPRRAAAGAGAVRDRDRRRSSRPIAPCSRRRRGHITLAFFARQGAGARPQLPAARARSAPTTARRFIASSAGSSMQGGMLNTRSAPLTRSSSSTCASCRRNSTTPAREGHVSMARTDDPASASTSFFICTAPAPSLDGKYTAFGRVVDGMDGRGGDRAGAGRTARRRASASRSTKVTVRTGMMAGLKSAIQIGPSGPRVGRTGAGVTTASAAAKDGEKEERARAWTSCGARRESSCGPTGAGSGSGSCSCSSTGWPDSCCPPRRSG